MFTRGVVKGFYRTDRRYSFACRNRTQTGFPGDGVQNGFSGFADLLTFFLLFITFVFAFTGNLLPWHQITVYATKVGRQSIEECGHYLPRVHPVAGEIQGIDSGQPDCRLVHVESILHYSLTHSPGNKGRI